MPLLLIVSMIPLYFRELRLILLHNILCQEILFHTHIIYIPFYASVSPILHDYNPRAVNSFNNSKCSSGLRRAASMPASLVRKHQEVTFSQRSVHVAPQTLTTVAFRTSSDALQNRSPVVRNVSIVLSSIVLRFN